MSSSRRPLLLAAAAMLAALVSGCGSQDSALINVVVIGETGDPFEKGVYLSTAGQLARASVAEGLVAFDEQGRVIPALADRWIVTDDGQSYIFRLRDGVWRDGSDLTAREAARSLRRTIETLRGTPLALDLAAIAQVREMAGRVIEIRLSYPAPYLLQLLAQPELGLLHEGQGAGPMRLERSGDTAVLTPIAPQQRGLPEIRGWDERARAIGLSAAEGGEAVSRFNAGEADLVLGGDIATFPLTASVGILRGTIQLDPVDGLFGFQVASRAGFLADPDNREAIALAIDREALIAPFGVAGWAATTEIVPTSARPDPQATVERWPDLTLENRQAVARARVSYWRQGLDAATQPADIRLWLPPGPGSDLLFERLDTDLAAIGLGVVRAKSAEQADLRLVDLAARYPGPMWYLNRFNCQAVRIACSPEADAALAKARRSSDPAERGELIAQAERLLTDANLFIAFGAPIRWSLVRGDAVGFATNAWGWHPLMPMAMLPK
jgi:ABC-type transport system substrate-binding protein